MKVKKSLICEAYMYVENISRRKVSRALKRNPKFLQAAVDFDVLISFDIAIYQLQQGREFLLSK